MADVPVGAVPAPTAPAAIESPIAKAATARAARAAKLAEVSKGIAAIDAKAKEPTETPAASVESATVPQDTKPAESPSTEAAPATEDKEKVEAKPDESDETLDPKTAKALAAIDKQAKRFRDEQAKARAELELERAELARIRSEVTGKASSFEDLQKLAKQDPVALLRKLGLESEDDFERVGRSAFPLTKAGKQDPRTRDVAQAMTEKQQLQQELAELKKAVEETRNEFKTRDQKAQAEAFVQRYLDEAVKAIPATPTLIGKLHAKSPEKARAAIKTLGAEMELAAMKADGATSYDPSYTPSHAEVIQEYEKRRRAELEEQGVDVEALLKPSTAAPPKTPPKTLDITAPTGTRPINGNLSRQEKIAAISRGIAKLDAERS